MGVGGLVGVVWVVSYVGGALPLLLPPRGIYLPLLCVIADPHHSRQ